MSGYKGGCKATFEIKETESIMTDDFNCISFGGKTRYSLRKLTKFVEDHGKNTTVARIILDSLLESDQAVIFHRDRLIPIYVPLPDKYGSHYIDHRSDIYLTNDITEQGILIGFVTTRDTVCVIKVGDSYYFGTAIQSPDDRYEKSYGNAMAFDRALARANVGNGNKKAKGILNEIKDELQCDEALPDKFEGHVSQPIDIFNYNNSFGTYFLERLLPSLKGITGADVYDLTESLLSADLLNQGAIG